MPRDLRQLITENGAERGDGDRSAGKIAQAVQAAAIGGGSCHNLVAFITVPLARLRGDRLDFAVRRELEHRRAESGKAKIGRTHAERLGHRPRIGIGAHFEREALVLEVAARCRQEQGAIGLVAHAGNGHVVLREGRSDQAGDEDEGRDKPANRARE